MSSIVLNCPSCRQTYQMSPEQITKYAGRTIACKKCKQPFSFDAAMDAAAQAAGQAEPEEEGPDVATAAAGGAEAGAEQGAYAVGESYAAKPPAPVAAPPPPRRTVAAPKEGRRIRRQPCRPRLRSKPTRRRRRSRACTTGIRTAGRRTDRLPLRRRPGWHRRVVRLPTHGAPRHAPPVFLARRRLLPLQRPAAAAGIRAHTFLFALPRIVPSPRAAELQRLVQPPCQRRRSLHDPRCSILDLPGPSFSSAAFATSFSPPPGFWRRNASDNGNRSSSRPLGAAAKPSGIRSGALDGVGRPCRRFFVRTAVGQPGPLSRPVAGRQRVDEPHSNHKPCGGGSAARGRTR